MHHINDMKDIDKQEQRQTHGQVVDTQENQEIHRVNPLVCLEEVREEVKTLGVVCLQSANDRNAGATGYTE